MSFNDLRTKGNKNLPFLLSPPLHELAPQTLTGPEIPLEEVTFHLLQVPGVRGTG